MKIRQLPNRRELAINRLGQFKRIQFQTLFLQDLQSGRVGQTIQRSQGSTVLPNQPRPDPPFLSNLTEG